MPAFEEKYDRRILTSMRHVLPELKMAEAQSRLNQEDIRSIGILLDHDNHENRQKIHKLVTEDPIFKPYYDESLDDQREHAIRRLRAFCNARIISVHDFETNPMNIFSAHETFGYIDGSYATKMTVQFNLFGGTLYRLGSEAHRQYYADKIDSAEVVGCFGLSELGYGNNAVEMETEAVYDADTDEFIIHSPSVLSQKYWITNGACHAHMCIVFAQLKIHGENQGVHGFLVPIRDQNLKVLPGRRVEDMGKKIGLNGIDNAKLLFDKVRIPRTEMLTSYAEVEKGGKYIWKEAGGKAPKMRDRFLKLADQLLSGRLCISSMMIGATKTVLFTSMSYFATRHGMGPSGKSDMAILEYQLVQDQVFPLLAKIYAVQFFHNFVKRQYALRQEYEGQRKAGKLSVGEQEMKNLHQEVIILCSTVKPMAAWLCDKSVTILRERVGGVGFLESNGYGGMFAHAGITAEGDARVLWAKVVKEMMEMVGTKRFSRTNELVSAANAQVPNLTVPTNVDESLKLLGQLKDVFAARTLLRLQRVMKLMKQSSMAATKEKPLRVQLFEASMSKYSKEIQSAAQAYAEWEALRSFMLVLDSRGAAPELTHNGPKPTRLSDNTVMALSRLALLFALECLHEDAVELINANMMTALQGITCQAVMSQLCKDIRPDVISLVRGFNLPEDAIIRPIAKNWKMYNEADNFGEVIDTGRFGTDKA
eukprot:GEMP01005539.1.p1 GENE.GEMP01005539.1~~GEMP01005539.1.p1  ORF type:complete len:706 (+),score=154.48 GEMP01005539.1:215-2332(+)